MNEFGQEHEPIDETADEVEVRKFLDGPPVEAPPAEPKRRVGWPKGKPRGPRKAKVALKAKAVAAGATRAAPVPASSAKTLTEIMFNVDRSTATVLEDAVSAIQGLSEESRKSVISALQRIFNC